MTADEGAPDARPLVSVVIAARDEGPHIERALSSLLAQRYPRIELIAVDDRSTDDTGAVFDRMAARDPRIQVVHITELPAGWLAGACSQAADAPAEAKATLQQQLDLRLRQDIGDAR